MQHFKTCSDYLEEAKRGMKIYEEHLEEVSKRTNNDVQINHVKWELERAVELVRFWEQKVAQIRNPQ